MLHRLTVTAFCAAKSCDCPIKAGIPGCADHWRQVIRSHPASVASFVYQPALRACLKIRPAQQISKQALTTSNVSEQGDDRFHSADMISYQMDFNKALKRFGI